MGKSIVIVVICALMYEPTREIHFGRQRGTYSNIELCKSGPPDIKASARSSVECSALCRNLMRNNCRSFKYQRESRACSLYRDALRFDFVENANGSCSGYQTVTAANCPEGFKYFVEGNKCLRMMTGKWNWSQAVKQCSYLHPNAHLVVVDTVKDWEIIATYGKAEVVPNCADPNNPRIHGYWTSGMAPLIKGTRQSFRWQTLSSSVRPLGKSAPWSRGQPNGSVKDASCIASFLQMSLDDESCLSDLCALCEVAMT